MQRLLKMDWNAHKSYRPKEPKGTAQTISDNLYIAIHICFCFCCVIEKSALNYGTHISTCKKWPIANTLFCADETILFAIKARPTTKICPEHIWLDQFTSGKISNDFHELLRRFNSSYPFFSLWSFSLWIMWIRSIEHCSVLGIYRRFICCSFFFLRLIGTFRTNAHFHRNRLLFVHLLFWHHTIAHQCQYPYKCKKNLIIFFLFISLILWMRCKLDGCFLRISQPNNCRKRSILMGFHLREYVWSDHRCTNQKLNLNLYLVYGILRRVFKPT